MNNAWFNIRFGSYHLKLDPDDGITFSQNPYHVKNKPTKWFVIYCWFGRSYSGE